MIDRYSVPELTAIWSDEHKFQTWLRVELAVVEAWGDEGVVPAEDVAAITSKAKVHLPDVMRYIEETHHDVTAFLRSVADSLGDESRWVHYGLTSNDVWDTATCLQFVDALDFLAAQVSELKSVIANAPSSTAARSASAARTAFTPNRRPSASSSPSGSTNCAVTRSASRSRASTSRSGRCPGPSARTPRCLQRSRRTPAPASASASRRSRRRSSSAIATPSC